MSSGAIVFVLVERIRSGAIADWLIVAIMISLPWSTSASSILLVFWIIAVIPTLNVISLRREILTAVAGFPVLLWVLAALAMVWAETSWYEGIQGLRGFNK